MIEHEHTLVLQKAAEEVEVKMAKAIAINYKPRVSILDPKLSNITPNQSLQDREV